MDPTGQSEPTRMVYAGFWRRTLALAVDVAVWTPILAAYFLSERFSIPVALTGLVAVNVLGLAYPIYFLARWGQTIGKMAARIQVVRVDGTPIAARHAWLRSSVDVGLSVVYLPFAVYTLVSWAEPDWTSIAWLDRGDELARRNPVSDLYVWLSYSWMLSELVVLLLNKKRRALHDFIAGTVVIKLGRPARRAT